jgi:hypothetical protein
VHAIEASRAAAAASDARALAAEELTQQLVARVAALEARVGNECTDGSSGSSSHAASLARLRVRLDSAEALLHQHARDQADMQAEIQTKMQAEAAEVLQAQLRDDLATHSAQLATRLRSELEEDARTSLAAALEQQLLDVQQEQLSAAAADAATRCALNGLQLRVQVGVVGRWGNSHGNEHRRSGKLLLFLMPPANIAAAAAVSAAVFLCQANEDAQARLEELMQQQQLQLQQQQRELLHVVPDGDSTGALLTSSSSRCPLSSEISVAVLDASVRARCVLCYMPPG